MFERKIRMHSSRMRTIHSGSRLPRGGVSARGVCQAGGGICRGVSAQRGLPEKSAWGCLPGVSEWVVVCPGVSAQGGGGVCLEVSAQGDVCPARMVASVWGVSAWGFLHEGCLPDGDVCWGVSTQRVSVPPVDRMTEACENITLPELRCGQ